MTVLKITVLKYFTKILKPIFGYLRNQGHISVIFVEYSFLQGDKSRNMRQLASIIGSVISIFHAITLGKMHYRVLERKEVSFLKKSGNFGAKIALNQHIVPELKRWLDAITKAVSDIHTPEVDFMINADASESGWGTTARINPTGGIWSEHYRTYHTNYLELKAIHLAEAAHQKCS